jgi:hypothetical protein
MIDFPCFKMKRQFWMLDFPKDRLAFHPPGMYNMDHILYVVNHALRRGTERIEKFSISKTGSMFSILGSDYSLELKWEESITRQLYGDV